MGTDLNRRGNTNGQVKYEKILNFTTNQENENLKQ